VKDRLPSAAEALPGRSTTMVVPAGHAVLGNPLVPPWPAVMQEVILGLGCFWGAERLFWRLRGVWTTAVGYAGGLTPNPTYHEVCSGRTGHAEVVRVVFDPQQLSFGELMRVFLEAHDPTQGMRQGNDQGTQYRSMVLTTNSAQAEAAGCILRAYDAALQRAGYPQLTTSLGMATEFYYAEPEHQQYLHHNPSGYCGLRGTGVACPLPG